jgi:hypothetical protein
MTAYNLAADEKTTTVMVYSRTKLIHGELVTRNNVRVSIWLRTQGVPNYMHLLKAQVLFFGGIPPKSLTYGEYFYPTNRILGFHLAPPAADPVDFDPNEANRRMVDVNLVVGTFVLKGKVRISTQTDFATSIEVGRTNWMSIYDTEISNPFMPQLPAIQVPMILVRPEQVSFGL